MRSFPTRTIKCPDCNAAPGDLCRSKKSGKPHPDLHAARRLISIEEAAKRGVCRLRKPIWSNPLDHLKIDLIEGQLGPWAHLYSPANRALNGRDPIDMLFLGTSIDDCAYAVYDGPEAESEEYQAECRAFAERFARFNRSAAG